VPVVPGQLAARRRPARRPRMPRAAAADRVKSFPSDEGAKLEVPAVSFTFGPEWARDTGCCGKPIGCTNMSPACLMRGHPWKRWHRLLKPASGPSCPPGPAIASTSHAQDCGAWCRGHGAGDRTGWARGGRRQPSRGAATLHRNRTGHLASWRGRGCYVFSMLRECGCLFHGTGTSQSSAPSTAGSQTNRWSTMTRG